MTAAGHPVSVNCFGIMASAMLGEWTTFEMDATGEVVSLSLPGQMYGVTFVKQRGTQSTIFL